LIVQRAERVPAAERDASNPLYYRDVLLYPNLGQPISKGQNKAVSFAFTMVPGATPVRATLLLRQLGRAIGEAPLALATPDADGVIRQVGLLPLASVMPGVYMLEVIVSADGYNETRVAPLRITE
jgi:hypothetical protein